MSPRFRQALVLAHRWVGLALTLPLLVTALTGFALVVARDIDRALQPELFKVSAPAADHAAAPDLDRIHHALQQRFGNDSNLIYRLPRSPDASLVVYVRGPWEGQVFVDPYSGRWLGERGEHQGWFNLLFELHGTLLADDTGRAVLAASAAACVLMLVSGLVLWWRTRAHPVRIRLHAGRVAWLFDLHRVSGLLLGALVLIAVVTGAYMAWRPLSFGVSALAGVTPVKPPRPPAAAVGSQRAGPDALLRVAEQALPGGLTSFIQWPASPTQAVRIRKRLADEMHPNGLSSVWLDPHSAAVLRVTHWREFDPGSRAFQWIYPLHSGALFGAANQLLLALAASALALFSVSGLWLWLARRRAASASTAARRARRATTATTGSHRAAE
jgi:uncharacterized iron-regulated membrane protein